MTTRNNEINSKTFKTDIIDLHKGDLNRKLDFIDMELQSFKERIKALKLKMRLLEERKFKINNQINGYNLIKENINKR